VISARLKDPKLAEKEDLLSLFIAETQRDGAHFVRSFAVNNGRDLQETDQLRGVVFTLIIAGRDTTASTLTWTIWELCRHPDVLRKVLQEVGCTAIKPE
jgi:cytochrome P450